MLLVVTLSNLVLNASAGFNPFCSETAPQSNMHHHPDSQPAFSLSSFHPIPPSHSASDHPV